MGKKQRRETAGALAAVPENESRVILATGSYVGEGFDDSHLDTLILAMPISWKGMLQQVYGLRLRGHLRSDAGKDVRAQVEGLCRDWLCDRAGDSSALPAGGRTSVGWGDIRARHWSLRRQTA